MSCSDSSSDDRKEKVCRKCLKMLPLNSYYAHRTNRDGLNGKCKECCIACTNERRRHLPPDDTDDTEPEDPPPKRPCRPSNLYVMCLSTDPGGHQYGLKIGRSCNIEERALALASSLPFDMVVLATIPGAGPVETAVHEHLANRRNTDSNAREWFRISLTEALIAIAVKLPA
jgi:hypothetical protein